VITERLLDRCAAEWRAATRHPFLDAARTGALQREAFDRWLVQDYLFVADLLRFQAVLLARAPRSAQAVLAGGLVGLEGELGWFEKHAAQRGLSLGVARAPSTTAYRTFLEQTAEADGPIGITALWALERAYLDAWSSAKPGAAAYAEFVEHWTSTDFVTYVAGLAQAADEALASATPHQLQAAEAAFVEVMRLERDFWPAP
jgi:formylaminopyrimidine deformylase / aminopyrimidine aminohydrolase